MAARRYCNTMSQAPQETINMPNAGIGTDTSLLLLLLLFCSQIGDDHYPPQSTQNQASRNGSSFVDGSGPIFSMYLEMATEEDMKMVENWKADADGILIFVRIYDLILSLMPNPTVIDRSILRCCRIVDLSVHSGPPAEPTGHLQLLSCEYLSGYDQPKCLQHLESTSCFSTPIFTFKLRSVG